MIWTREQAKALIDRALSLSKAEETFVDAQRRRPRQPALRAQHRHHVRRHRRATASRSPRASARSPGTVDDRRVRRCQPAAGDARTRRRSPGSRRTTPKRCRCSGRRPTAEQGVFRRRGRRSTPEWRAAAAATAIELSKQKGVVSAGFVDTSASIQAVATSKGLFGYDRQTAADYNLTARTADGSGSGWASKSFNELRLLEPAKLATAAIDKAVRSKNAAAIEPGKYTVVLEPAALGRSARVPDVQRRCAAGRRGAQLLLEEGRRQPHRRAGARREGEHLLGSGASAGADADVRRRAACRSSAPTWVENGVWKDLSTRASGRRSRTGSRPAARRT